MAKQIYSRVMEDTKIAKGIIPVLLLIAFLRFSFLLPPSFFLLVYIFLPYFFPSPLLFLFSYFSSRFFPSVLPLFTFLFSSLHSFVPFDPPSFCFYLLACLLLPLLAFNFLFFLLIHHDLE